MCVIRGLNYLVKVTTESFFCVKPLWSEAVTKLFGVSYTSFRIILEEGTTARPCLLLSCRIWIFSPILSTMIVVGFYSAMRAALTAADLWGLAVTRGFPPSFNGLPSLCTLPVFEKGIGPLKSSLSFNVLFRYVIVVLLSLNIAVCLVLHIE